MTTKKKNSELEETPNIYKPETEGLTKFYNELVKNEEKFCLYVEFKKSSISRISNITSENRIELVFVPCIEIVHVQGMIRFTPIYIEGYENFVCLSDFWSYYEGDNYLICQVLFHDALEVIKKSNLEWEALPSIREKLKLKNDESI
jgi:hypothetical protein